MNDAPDKTQSWWSRLSGGLKRTSASIGTALTDLVARRKLDRAGGQALIQTVRSIGYRLAGTFPGACRCLWVCCRRS